mmetsp:Transcript_4844/g.4492  ORF Transcript_4844/g.4492 Transcript_4844/m.4492 type:complete len:111 (-) Transcript_4844:213-545(-)
MVELVQDPSPLLRDIFLVKVEGALLVKCFYDILLRTDFSQGVKLRVLQSLVRVLESELFLHLLLNQLLVLLLGDLLEEVFFQLYLLSLLQRKEVLHLLLVLQLQIAQRYH